MAQFDPEADAQAFSKQYDEQQAAQQQAQEAAKQPVSSPMRWMTQVGRVSTQQIDAALNDEPMENDQAARKTRDVAAGAITGATNIADSAMSLAKDNADDIGMGPLNAAIIHRLSPIWDHAKAAILDFRDAVQVKDPTLSDNLTQGVAQLAIPFAGYSRALAGLHGFANMAAAGAVTDATALQPHDMRMADVLALERHTEGKLGAALRTLAPDGSAVNAYINYLTDRGNESEAEGRFKNVLDGFGVNLIATPLLHAAAVTLKQGAAGVRYAMENGALSTGDLFKMGPAPGSPAAQRGMVAFHGTPHDFDLSAGFDNGRIGTGEGAQVFGFGHYLAEEKQVAEGYRRRLAMQAAGGLSVAMDDAKDAVEKAGGDPRKAYIQMSSLADNEQDATLRSRMQQAAKMIKSGNYNRATGSLVTADIADSVKENMLHWDRPLSEQPKAAKVFSRFGISDQKLTGGEAYRQLSEKLAPEMPSDPLGTPRGWGYAQRGNEGDRHAAALLNFNNIPGIQYLDGGSRSGGEGTHNYVVFDGKNIKILGKEK